jgi:hypothetical protein
MHKKRQFFSVTYFILRGISIRNNTQVGKALSETCGALRESHLNVRILEDSLAQNITHTMGHSHEG